MTTNYIPAIENISAVSIAFRAVITTSVPHDYEVGNTITFIIPAEFGMRELDGLTANISAVGNTKITTDINTLEFTPFIAPVTVSTPAQVVPVGGTNSGLCSQDVVPTPIGVCGAFRITQT